MKEVRVLYRLCLQYYLHILLNTPDNINRIMLPNNKEFLFFKIAFSLFLIISSTIILPQVNSQPAKKYLTQISKAKDNINTFLPVKEDSIFVKLNQYTQGLFKWLINLLTFLLNIIQKLINFMSNAIQLVYLVERVIDAITLLIDVINQLINAISDLFSPDSRLLFLE